MVEAQRGGTREHFQEPAPTLEKWLLKMPGDHVDESTRGYVLNELER
jgi:hypothetical protein